MLAKRRIRIATSLVLAIATAAVAGTALAGAQASVKSRAAAPNIPAQAADCQPFASEPCLLPFPNNLFTRQGHTSTPTGLRVHLPARGDAGQHEGRSGWASGRMTATTASAPGSAVIVHVNGFDNATGVPEDQPGGPARTCRGRSPSGPRSS